MQNSNYEAYIFPNNTISRCPWDPPAGQRCEQGSIPPIGVDARTPEDIQNAVRFARQYNLKIVVHNTGHDLLGRSAGRGGFLIWTHRFKEITFHDSFVPTNGPSSSAVEAATLGSGVQWTEAHRAANDRNRLFVGGVSAAGTVGAAGGWILGGGHSPMGATFGFGVDNVLEFKIVTPDAQFQTVNAYTNPDLFWALRGGGGGTFGIVTSVTYRTHPNLPIIGSFATANFSSPEIAQTVVTELLSLHPNLTDRRWGGYSSFTNETLVLFYIAPNASMAEATAFISPFFEFLTNITQGAAQTGIVPFASFLEWSNSISPPSQGSTAGMNTEISSRLFPRDTALNRPAETAKSLLSLPGGVGGVLCVAGGNSARIDPDSVAFHPSWRKALALIYISESWDQNASVTEIRAAQQKLIDNTAILDTISSDSAAYYNEASLHETDFRKSFWGPHYSRVRQIKRQVDPTSLFIVPRGVASEEWDADVNCRL
ncbi:hypothetical protein MD484_g7967, partial [Candolleomyces efflorescens]